MPRTVMFQDKMLKVEKDSANRSLKTNRLFPTANKPDPMPQNLAFLFTKITPEQPLDGEWRNPLQGHSSGEWVGCFGRSSEHEAS